MTKLDEELVNEVRYEIADVLARSNGQPSTTDIALAVIPIIQKRLLEEMMVQVPIPYQVLDKIMDFRKANGISLDTDTAEKASESRTEPQNGFDYPKDGKI